MLDGQSDAAHHWAHILLNHDPGRPVAKGAELGAGPRYYRWQIELPAPLPLDGVSEGQIARLRECGEALADGRAGELKAVAGALAGAGRWARADLRPAPAGRSPRRSSRVAVLPVLLAAVIAAGPALGGPPVAEAGAG